MLVASAEQVSRDRSVPTGWAYGARPFDAYTGDREWC